MFESTANNNHNHSTLACMWPVFRVCSAWLLSCQSKGRQVEVWRVVSFSWMNINTIHAITTLVIFRGLLPQPDSHRSNLMKTLNLLVRLIVYMGKLNALGRMWGHDETKAAAREWKQAWPYKWKIWFSLNIAFHLLIHCRGGERGVRRQGEQMDSSEHVMREQEFGGGYRIGKPQDGVTDQMQMVLKTWLHFLNATGSVRPHVPAYWFKASGRIM